MFTPLGTITFNGSGTQQAPQLVEVMSQDEGNVASGFTANFAYGTIVVNAGTYVALVDQSKNTSSGEPEALYVKSLIVKAGATLDLQNLHVYAQSAQIDGTITHGSVSQTSHVGGIPLNSPEPATISSAGQLDDWTFFGRAGRLITIVVDPGSGTSSGPNAPFLGWVQVKVLDPAGNVIAAGNNISSGTGTIVSLSAVALAKTGTYTVAVQAPSGESTATGNYYSRRGTPRPTSLRST